MWVTQIYSYRLLRQNLSIQTSDVFISNTRFSASGVRLARVPLHQVEHSTHDARDHRRRAHARDDISKRMSATLHVRHAAAKLGFSSAHQTQVERLWQVVTKSADLSIVLRFTVHSKLLWFQNER